MSFCRVAVGAGKVVDIFTQIDRVPELQAVKVHLGRIIDCLRYDCMAEITVF